MMKSTPATNAVLLSGFTGLPPPVDEINDSAAYCVQPRPSLTTRDSIGIGLLDEDPSRGRGGILARSNITARWRRMRRWLM
jgi:hypothetical protein